MKIVAKLLSGSLTGETLMETEELNLKLATVCDTFRFCDVLIFSV